MPAKFIFTNILGVFVFNENYKLVDGLLFKDLDQFDEKEKHEKQIEEKHGSLEKPSGDDLYKILEFFKDKKYLSELRKKNIALTRVSVKDSVNNDLLIIQTIDAVEELNRTINLLTKRLREWYSLYNPEVSNKVKDHEKFVSSIVQKKKDKLLEELNIDKNDSLGAELKEKDVAAILLLASQINNHYKLRSHYEKYLQELEKETCPNLASILGVTISARLLDHSGSLKRLAEMPASTLQILGAEKALFRHLKNKRNPPPKYGMIHEHPLILNAPRKNHGRIARALADKASIAVRVDYFKGEFMGDKLRKDLEKKIKGLR